MHNEKQNIFTLIFKMLMSKQKKKKCQRSQFNRKLVKFQGQWILLENL